MPPTACGSTLPVSPNGRFPTEKLTGPFEPLTRATSIGMSSDSPWTMSLPFSPSERRSGRSLKLKSGGGGVVGLSKTRSSTATARLSDARTRM